jgi:multimeric flavodoxin WrbA
MGINNQLCYHLNMNKSINQDSTTPRLVVILKASPRAKSNSSLLADELALGVKDDSAEVKAFSLCEMDIHPCDGCDGCHQTPGSGCVVDDDMQLIYPFLLRASAVVLATPVYWFTFSAQLKLAVDRFYALDSPDGHGLKGKSMALLMAYGDIDPYTSGAVNAIHTFEDMCRYTGSPVAGILYGTASAQGEMAANTDLLEKAHKLGVKLAQV